MPPDKLISPKTNGFKGIFRHQTEESFDSIAIPGEFLVFPANRADIPANAVKVIPPAFS